MWRSFPTVQLNSAQKLRCQKYSTIIGCYILLLPNGIFWYWGNMSVYCMSYILFVKNSSEDLDSPWLFALHKAFWTLGTLCSGTIAEIIGRKGTILSGIIIFDAGIFGGFFTVQNSLAALICTMGVATGAGMGLMYGSALQFGIEWSDGKVGFVTALIQGFVSVGSLAVNQGITLYMNPKNLYPDFYRSPTKYFSQRGVLQKVPYTFLILGSFSFSLHLVALAMVRQRPLSNTVDLANAGNVSEATLLTENGLTHKDENEQSRPSLGQFKIVEGKESTDYTYRQMFKTKSFQTMWVTFL